MHRYLVCFLLFSVAAFGQVSSAGRVYSPSNQPINIGAQPLESEFPNAAAGTSTGSLVKLIDTSGTLQVTKTAITDTNNAYGCVQSGAGTSGKAQVAFAGTANCLFDNVAITDGDFVVVSVNTAGTLSDSGSGTAAPTGVLNMGKASGTHAPCGAAPCGPYTVILQTPDALGAAGTGIIATPNVQQTVQPSTDVTGLVVKQSNTTNTADIYNIQDKSANKVLQVDKAGNVVFRGPGPYINVKAYGAVGDGVANDTTAINNAITACAGKALFFPPGTYLHTAQITLNASCTLFAYPGTATIKKGYNSTSGLPGANGSLIISASNVTLRGLTYDGNQASFTGYCISDGTNNTDVTVDYVSILNCDGNSLTFTAASGGSTGVTRLRISNSRIVCGTGTAATGAITLQQTITDVIITNNFLDCSNDTWNGGAGTIESESQGLTTSISHVTISGNHIITPNCGLGILCWGIQGGAFNAYASTDWKVIGNDIKAGGNGAGAASLPEQIGTVVANNVWDEGSFVSNYAAWEMIQETGLSFTGNVTNHESSGTGGMCIIVSSTNFSSFTGNTCNGWPENGGIGITVAAGGAAQTLTACSESGNVATFTTSGALNAWFQPGTSVTFSGLTPAGYNSSFPLTIINTSYVRTAGTFSVIMPTTGLGACTVFGQVNSTSSNNTFTSNTLNFPVGTQATPSNPRYGFQLRCTNSGCSTNNNVFQSNIVSGTLIGTENAISFQGAGTSDSNTIANNTLINVSNGFNLAFGTNNNCLQNTYVGVTTQVSGAAGTACSVQYTKPLTLHLTAQTADVAATTLLTPPFNMAGTVDTYIIVTGVGTTSTMPTVCVTWKDGDSTVNQTLNVSASSTGNTTTTFAVGHTYIRDVTSAIQVKTGGNCTGGTAYASTGTAMQFALSAQFVPQGN